MKKEPKIQAPRRTERLEARLTNEEFNKVIALASECGLSISEYTRRTALSKHPRKRLDDREIEALCSLSDARTDLIKVAAAVKGIQNDKRGLLFKDTAFVESWMKEALPLIERWGNIIEQLNQ